MKMLLPIVAMLCTACSTLMAVVFCMSMGANATPAQSRTIKLWMLGLSLLGIIGIAIGIHLMRTGQHGVAAAAAIAPTVIFGLVLVVATLK